MRALGLTLGGVLALAGIFVYSQWFAPSAVMQTAFEEKMRALDAAVSAGDKVAVRALLEQGLSADAQVSLTIEFTTMLAQTSTAPARSFDKAGFLTFADEVLAKVSATGLYSRLTRFEPSDDRASATFATLSSGQGEGMIDGSLTGGRVHYMTGIDCEGEASYADVNTPAIRRLSCTVRVHLLPSGSAADVQGVMRKELGVQIP